MAGLSNKSHLIKRRLCVDVTGSLQQFAKSGPDAALWAPNNAKIGEILGVSDVFDNIPDVGLTAACLQNAVLHKIRTFRTSLRTSGRQASGEEEGGKKNEMRCAHFFEQ